GVDAGEGLPGDRGPDDTDHHYEDRAERIGDERDAEGRRPAAHLKHLDPQRLDSHQDRDSGAQQAARAGKGHPMQQNRSVGQSLEKDRRGERNQDRKGEKHQCEPGVMASMSSVPVEWCTRCASTSEKASTPKPMTIAVRTSDCGTGSANTPAVVVM